MRVDQVRAVRLRVEDDPHGEEFHICRQNRHESFRGEIPREPEKLRDRGKGIRRKEEWVSGKWSLDLGSCIMIDPWRAESCHVSGLPWHVRCSLRWPFSCRVSSTEVSFPRENAATRFIRFRNQPARHHQHRHRLEEAVSRALIQFSSREWHLLRAGFEIFIAYWTSSIDDTFS